MTSLLKAALEGDATVLTSAAPEAGNDKDLVELKGPLSQVFAEALAKEYPRNKPAETAEDQTALESQANDALAMQTLVSHIQLAGETPPGGNALTIYGVAADDVKPEHIVEVSQDLAERGEDSDDFVLVMDATQPSVNSPDASNAEPRVEVLGSALEALCEAYGVRVFPSLEAFAQAYVDGKASDVNVATEGDLKHALKEAKKSPFNRFSFRLYDHACYIAKKIDAAHKAGFAVKISPGAKGSLEVNVSGTYPGDGKKVDAMCSTECNVDGH